MLQPQSFDRYLDAALALQSNLIQRQTGAFTVS